MTTVLAPNAAYSGATAGVRFVDGRADTDDARALARLRRAGYTVVTAEPAPSAPETEGESHPDATDPARADETADGGPELPAGNASHAVWVAWAVEHGGLDQATAEAMTRDELRAAYSPSAPETEG